MDKYIKNNLPQEIVKLIDCCVDIVEKDSFYDPAKSLQTKTHRRDKIKVALIEMVEKFTVRIGRGLSILTENLQVLSSQEPKLFLNSALNEIIDLQNKDLKASGIQLSEEETKNITPCEVYDISDESMEIYYNVADCLYQNGKYHEASDVLFFINQLYSYESIYWQALGSADYYAENYNEAIYAYFMALLNNPDDPKPLLFIAHCYENQKQLENAIPCLDYLLEIVNKNPDLIDELKQMTEDYKTYINTLLKK